MRSVSRTAKGEVKVRVVIWISAECRSRDGYAPNTWSQLTARKRQARAAHALGKLKGASFTQRLRVGLTVVSSSLRSDWVFK